MSPWVANVGEAAAEQWNANAETVCISISEPKRPELPRLPKGFADVLRLQFQDYDPQRIHWERVEDASRFVLFTPNLGARLARFIRKHRGKNILVHCAAGISRSGAVTEAVLQAFPEYEDKGWPRFPNCHVLTILKRALGLVPLGYEEPRPVPGGKYNINWCNEPSNDPVVVEDEP